MKRLKLIAVMLVMLFMMNGCSQSSSKEDVSKATSAAEKTETTTASDSELLTGLHHVEIDIKDYGVIALELDADTAPISVTNFITLAKNGFYDGLTFHRIMNGFMMQGGDGSKSDKASMATTIKGEFEKNGVKNDISHVRGTISMARATPYDSGSSQFFIVHKDSQFLDGQYAGFGHVTSGIEIVDKICENVPEEDDNGTILAKNQPVINSIKVID